MSWLERVALVLVFVGALLVAPPYIEQALAPEPAPAARRIDPVAPIWSWRCMASGRAIVAHQSDGGPWRVHCARAEILLAAEPEL